MPFRENSPFFRPEVLAALTAADNSAWHQLSARVWRRVRDQTSVAKKNLTQIILPAACTLDRARTTGPLYISGKACRREPSVTGGP